MVLAQNFAASEFIGIHRRGHPLKGISYAADVLTKNLEKEARASLSFVPANPAGPIRNSLDAPYYEIRSTRN